MRTHALRTWPKFFQAIKDGTKTFEIRRDDRGFKVGDELELREYDPSMDRYTDNSVKVSITYILRDPHFGLQDQHCVMAIKLI